MYISLLYCSFTILLIQGEKIVQQTPFSLGSKFNQFFIESNSTLSPSVSVDTMENKETMEVETRKESPNNQEFKSKRDGDILSGIKNVISTLITFF